MKTKAAKAAMDMLVRQCDKLWRRIILLRAGCRCEMCGASRESGYRSGKIVWVQACHIISRRFWSVRWDLRNGVAGCQDCHNDKTIMDWLRRTDKRRYNWIIGQKRKQVPRRDIDLEKILRKLQAA